MRTAATVFIGLSIATAAWAGAAERETLTRALSANQAMIDRFLSQPEHGLDEEARARRAQKIAVLDNANERILLQLAKEREPASDKEPTGERWKHMLPSDRERFVFSALHEMEEKDVRLARPSAHYARVMDEVFVSDPGWARRPLKNLLLYVLLKESPGSRQRIRSLALGDAA